MNLSHFVLDLQLKQKELAGDEEEDSASVANNETASVQAKERETAPKQNQE